MQELLRMYSSVTVCGSLLDRLHNNIFNTDEFLFFAVSKSFLVGASVAIARAVDGTSVGGG
jgi:hypothetical protein